MFSTRKYQLPGCSFTANIVALFGIYAWAITASAATREISKDAEFLSFWVMLAFVQFMSIIGYIGSSLPQWASWIDCEGEAKDVLERRLTLIAGAIVSVFAGNIAYYGGYYEFNQSHVTSFIAAGLAGFAGDKAITPLLHRYFGKPPPPNP